MGFMRFGLLVTVLVSMAAAQGWDTSGNGMLKGTYYFREVVWVPGDNAADLSDAVALYGTVQFDGNGNFASQSATVYEPSVGQQGAPIAGTYSIAASGHGFLLDPVAQLFGVGPVFVYGVVSQQGIFIGSSTESGYNNLFIAAPLSSPAPTNASLKGTYWIADINQTALAQSLYASSSLFQMTADGAGSIGSVTGNGYFAGGGSQVYTQNPARIPYGFQNGAGILVFQTSQTTLTFLQGQEYLYISPDGNFVFGGSPQGWDFFVGVRTSSGSPSLGGLYYQAGADLDASQLSSNGVGVLDTFYGSFNAGSGLLVGHQRVEDLFNNSAVDAIYSQPYSVQSNGTYSDGFQNYVVGANGIRIGSGIGPYLGISVALPAPSLSGSGVFLNPEFIENAATFAPGTAGIAPGELVSLVGTNLANGNAIDPTFPTTLNGVQVMMNGIAAPILSVTPTLVTAIVPYGVTTAIAQIQVINNNTSSNTATMFVNLTAPGVFLKPLNGVLYGATLHQNFTLVTPSNPAQPGETVSVFMTGMGAVNPSVPDGSPGPAGTFAEAVMPTVFIGALPATVSFAGLAPELIGLYQLNVQVPTSATSGDNVLYISGADAYSSEAVIPVGSGSTASAAPAVRPYVRMPQKASGKRRNPTGPASR